LYESTEGSLLLLNLAIGLFASIFSKEPADCFLIGKRVRLKNWILIQLAPVLPKSFSIQKDSLIRYTAF